MISGQEVSLTVSWELTEPQTSKVWGSEENFLVEAGEAEDSQSWGDT